MLRLAVEAIRRGAIVGLPTDTVYGLAVDPFNGRAVADLHRLKGRPGGKPIALLVGSLEAASTLGLFNEQAVDLAGRHWPGPLTIVVRTLVGLPEWVGDGIASTVGIRYPDHETARDLLRETGPLAVTSANLARCDPAIDEVEARAIFGEAVAVYLEGKGGGLASTVVDSTGPDIRVLRAGPLEL